MFKESIEADTLKVSISPSFPLDPSKIKTMSDYDLALILHRNWFDYDNKRVAIPGLISSWSFDHKLGHYLFKISQKAKWSDGSNVTSAQLIDNLKRLINQKDSYAITIDAIVDISNVKIFSESEFTLPTRNKKPSESFFQRMGSIFLAVIHPSSWDNSGNIINNNITLGPYKISKFSTKEIFLSRNNHDFLAFKNRFEKIHIKYPENKTNIEDFLEGKSFEDITQTYTLMPKDLYQKILDKKLPYWTRSFDRVSYLAPIKSYQGNDPKLRNFILLIGKLLRDDKSKDLIADQVQLASSLQPLGYPLHEPIIYSKIDPATLDLPNEISILGTAGYQFEYQKRVIEELVKRFKIKVIVKFSTKNNILDFFKEINSSSKFDLKILSFGVADREAATWLSLVLNKDGPFIELSKKDHVDFEKILKNYSGKNTETNELKKLLLEIGKRGSYLPLFHFSTMSLARQPISFENIKELDETVDYSKLKIK